MRRCHRPLTMHTHLRGLGLRPVRQLVEIRTLTWRWQLGFVSGPLRKGRAVVEVVLLPQAAKQTAGPAHTSPRTGIPPCPPTGRD